MHVQIQLPTYTYPSDQFLQYVLTLNLMLVSFSEMLDGCRALLAIANVTTPHDFDGLLKSMRS